MSEAAVPPVRRVESCRLCGHTPLTDLLSLGTQFVSNFVPKEQIRSGVECPIELVLCPGCGLVQQRWTAPQELLYRGTYWYRCIGASEKIFARVKGWGRNSRDCLVHERAEEIFSSPYEVELPCVQRDGTVEWRPVLHREVSVRRVSVIEFHTGPRVVASLEHKWPLLSHRFTWRDDKQTKDLKPGDRVAVVHDMPRPDEVIDHGSIYDEEAGYFVGVFLAEGSRKNAGLILTVHETKDDELTARVKEFVTGRLYEGLSVRHEPHKHTNCVSITGPVVNGLINKFVRGQKSLGKYLRAAVWAQPKAFLKGLIDGWLDGDGHFEADQERWRFNIGRNSNLVEDLALACRVVGYRMRYRMRQAEGKWQYCGWVRKSDHRMRQHRRLGELGCTSVKRIWKQGSAKRVWDVAVGGDELYSLGCGIVTHNSGTNATMRACLREVAADCEQLAGLTAGDVVLDAGCNDGTLLRAYGVGGLTRVGVEPASNFREEGARGVDVFINDFWDYFRYSAAVKKRARVVTALGMFYDLDDPQRFVEHLAMALAPGGLFVAQLMCLKQTIRMNDVGNLTHEHLLFYSLNCLEKMFAVCGLKVVDLYENDVNGGSYRLYVTHESGPRGWQPRPGAEERLARARQEESDMGLSRPDTYRAWDDQLFGIRRDLREVVFRAHAEGRSIFAYGSSTKGNVILQWAGLGHELIAGAADRSPAKWGLYTVGTGIPIMSEEAARLLRPDYFLMLPYAFRQEFIEREDLWRKRGGKWLIPLPRVEVV